MCCWAFVRVALLGRIVSNGSDSSEREGLFTVRSPSKLSSQFDSSVTVSKEAKALSFSEDNKPPKLSCGRRWGSCRALGDIAEAKSSSQLSSDVLQGDLNGSVLTRGFGRWSGPRIGVVTMLPGSRRPGMGLEDIGLEPFRDDPASGDFRAAFHCCTLLTASSYSVGFLGTTASDRFAFTIHGCLRSLRAETLKFGSF